LRAAQQPVVDDRFSAVQSLARARRAEGAPGGRV